MGSKPFKLQKELKITIKLLYTFLKVVYMTKIYSQVSGSHTVALCKEQATIVGKHGNVKCMNKSLSQIFLNEAVHKNILNDSFWIRQIQFLSDSMICSHWLPGQWKSILSVNNEINLGLYFPENYCMASEC